MNRLKSKICFAAVIITLLSFELQAASPYPPSPVISSVSWDAKSTITRLAKGSDTFPITWADDDKLYTTFGDGWGFEPLISQKLSLGLASVTGSPSTNDVVGLNIRSATGEQVGQGAFGKKASGMLMVDGTLYMMVRNADKNGNYCQLAWSDDYAKTWSWSSWQFTEFGYCVFLNYGKNYAGARDDYVYLYSPDEPNAYTSTDTQILMRVPKTSIKNKSTYEYLSGFETNGSPQWSENMSDRVAVFTHEGKVARTGIVYNASLQRYLWWQMIPGNGDIRFTGGFAIYDAPEPWGPWTTAFYTEQWDTGPGETASFPTKWISDDGKTAHLVFSGDDYFSIRKATFTVKLPKKPSTPSGLNLQLN